MPHNDKTEQAMNLFIAMTDDEIATTVSYLAGNLAFRFGQSPDMNVTYPPVPENDSDLYWLRLRILNFTSAIQREIEHIRKNKRAGKHS